MPSVADTKPVVWLSIGVFLGVLIGAVMVIVATSEDTSESYEDYRRRVEGGRRPEAEHNHPPRQPAAAPPETARRARGGGDRAQASFAKVHFMKKFVGALTERPDNMFPNFAYEPLLKPGAKIVCADCHDPRSLNLEGMIRNDPGSEAVEPFRRDRRGFMIPLMKAWVKRLNKRHGDRLRKPVTCTSCHAWEPGSREGNRVLPPLMANFVRALKERPRNGNPASGWKPLLKDPSTPSMFCATCHGKVGAMMERNLESLAAGRVERYAGDHRFMVHLMERWVKRLNREMGGQLVKEVTCTDCHETDPRR